MSTGDPTQIRDGLAAYARYLAQMDATMRQKVALTAAHLLGEGRVARHGDGLRRAGSFALAALYPRLEVVGVDLDPTMVELARKQHVLPNLRFEVGDIAKKVFDDGSLDGIFDSSCAAPRHLLQRLRCRARGGGGREPGPGPQAARRGW
jgi:SAM-dependent methyltransferase